MIHPDRDKIACSLYDNDCIILMPEMTMTMTMIFMMMVIIILKPENVIMILKPEKVIMIMIMILKPEKVRTSRRFSLSQATIPSRLISGRLCFILYVFGQYFGQNYYYYYEV